MIPTSAINRIERKNLHKNMNVYMYMYIYIWNIMAARMGTRDRI